MSIFDILIIAVALAMDCFSVSVAAGVAIERPRFRTVLVMGWLTGGSVAHLIQAFDHWVAFGLLAFIGGGMIRESLAGEENRPLDVTRVKTLFELAVATSVDALVVGVDLGLMQNALVVPALIIAAVSFLLTIVGFYLGVYFKRICKFNFGLVGGIVLICIGLKILIEHLMS